MIRTWRDLGVWALSQDRKVPEIKEWLKRFGLPVSGTKKELIERLTLYIDQQGDPAGEIPGLEPASPQTPDELPDDGRPAPIVPAAINGGGDDKQIEEPAVSPVRPALPPLEDEEDDELEDGEDYPPLPPAAGMRFGTRDGDFPPPPERREDNRTGAAIERLIPLGILAGALLLIVAAIFLLWSWSPWDSNIPASSSTVTAEPTTSTPLATATPNATENNVENDPIQVVTTFRQGEWEVSGTERLSENPIVDGWIKRLEDPDPASWRTFPNIPNPDVREFRVVNGSEVPDGMEYGTYSTPYCWSSPCDIPVGAWEYRLITGDYEALGYECQGDKQKGCLLLLLNVMDESVTFRDQYVDNGFTLRGRYWNGDALEVGTWGLVSHASANLLNMETFSRPGEILNAGDPGNSGANCGVPSGCNSVDVRVVVVAGDAVIAVLETTVLRP